MTSGKWPYMKLYTSSWVPQPRRSWLLVPTWVVWDCNQPITWSNYSFKLTNNSTWYDLSNSMIIFRSVPVHIFNFWWLDNMCRTIDDIQHQNSKPSIICFLFLIHHYLSWLLDYIEEDYGTCLISVCYNKTWFFISCFRYIYLRKIKGNSIWVNYVTTKQATITDEQFY